MDADIDYKTELLVAWEETHKKGLLTLWIFLALKDGPKYVDEIKETIERFSDHTLTCEEQSLYRALRKFCHLELVAYENGKGDKGPDRKYYHLTPLGAELLDAFVQRNIAIFLKPSLFTLLNLERRNT